MIVIDWEPHRLLEIYKNSVSLLASGESFLFDTQDDTCQYCIFAADGGHDCRLQCELSGEPLIQSMRPSRDAHKTTLDVPLAKVLVGEPNHLSAYDVTLLCHGSHAP